MPDKIGKQYIPFQEEFDDAKGVIKIRKAKEGQTTQ